MAFSRMVDLELSEDDREEMQMPVLDPGDRKLYPHGCCLCLCGPELDKLGLDIDDAAVGDVIDLRAFGEVTAVEKRDGPFGPQRRLEIQLTRLAVENESDEEPDE